MTTDTQLEGLRAIAPKAPTIRKNVLSIFEKHLELTDPELNGYYAEAHGPKDVRIINTRRGELCKEGLIQHSGRKKKNPATDVDNIIWELVR